MPDDNRPRIERFDFIDSGKPILEAFFTGLHEIGMRAVVDGVACDDETDRGDVKAGSVIGIRVADIDGDDCIAFETEGPAVERLGGCKTIWDLSRKSSFPVLNGIRVQGLFASSRPRAAKQTHWPTESDRAVALSRRNGRDAHG